MSRLAKRAWWALSTNGHNTIVDALMQCTMLKSWVLSIEKRTHTINQGIKNLDCYFVFIYSSIWCDKSLIVELMSSHSSSLVAVALPSSFGFHSSFIRARANSLKAHMLKFCVRRTSRQVLLVPPYVQADAISSTVSFSFHTCYIVHVKVKVQLNSYQKFTHDSIVDTFRNGENLLNYLICTIRFAMLTTV